MHNGMINVDGEKMSKSLGNFITVRELLATYPGELLRFALLSAQYRSVLNWSDDLLNQARQSLDRFYGALRDSNDLPETKTDAADNPVIQALMDDLNTPQAIAEMHHLTQLLYQDNLPDNEKAVARAQLLAGGSLLGIFNHSPTAWFQEVAVQNQQISAADIEARLSERQQAKKDKNFARADAIRDELDGLGVEIQDTREGTRWQWK